MRNKILELVGSKCKFPLISSQLRELYEECPNEKSFSCAMCNKILELVGSKCTLSKCKRISHDIKSVESAAAYEECLKVKLSSCAICNKILRLFELEFNESLS